MKYNSLTIIYFALLLLIISCSKEEPISTGEESPTTNLLTSANTWTKYCGWHYNNGTSPKWGGWVREYEKNGFGLFITDPGTGLINQSLLENSYQDLGNLNSDIDIMQLAGGLGSAKDTTGVINWMNYIENDHGLKWKDIVYAQSLKLTNLADANERVYWQIGNEISSPSYSKTIRYWQGQPFGDGIPYDNFIIPFYVENFLAPTIEAIDRASVDAYGQAGKINICLGSLTNASSNSAQTFLSELLNYEIAGNNSPSLNGKKVSDLIHIITIHYTVGTASTADWENILNHYKNYSGTGRIKGVWSTEEVGINSALGGAGNLIGSLATFRYLEWAINNGYTSKEVRTNYYGWNTGDERTTVNTFNQFLYNFIGDRKLSNIPKSSTLINSTHPIEMHSFLTEDNSKRVLAIYPERAQSQPNTQISSIVLKKDFWNYNNEIKPYKYNLNGINLVNIEIIDSNAQIELIFSTPIELDYYSGLIILTD